MTEHFEGDAVLRQSQMLEEKIVNHPSQELDVTDDRGTEVSMGQNGPQAAVPNAESDEEEMKC